MNTGWVYYVNTHTNMYAFMFQNGNGIPVARGHIKWKSPEQTRDFRIRMAYDKCLTEENFGWQSPKDKEYWAKLATYRQPSLLFLEPPLPTRRYFPKY